MQVAGIIAEYNPFHNGHKYLIEKLRESGVTHIIAAMSGNFVQRGEPALFETDTRVKAALAGGVDLVLQLPVAYSVSGAANFAYGGVSLLNATGVVDTLAFGSECGDIKALESVSKILLSGCLEEKIRKELETGITYAKARENALKNADEKLAGILAEPNNILAVEYINSLKKLDSKIAPYTIKRMGASHDSSEKVSNIASASEIRKMIVDGENWGNFVPNSEIYYDNGKINFVAFNKFEIATLYKMRIISADEIAKSPDVSEGIENRIFAAARQAATLDELYSLAKTKRYTHARIRRIVLNTMLEITAEDAAATVPYIRVLGFNDRGAELIRVMKNKAKLPLVTKAADIASLPECCKNTFELERRTTDIYSLFLENPDSCNAEVKRKVIINTEKKD